MLEGFVQEMFIAAKKRWPELTREQFQAAGMKTLKQNLYGISIQEMSIQLEKELEGIFSEKSE